MRIGVSQASTRAEINELLYQSVKKAVDASYDVYNIGIFSNEIETYSYVEVAVMISLLIETGSVDFVVTGCSSGQGMMLACNSLPGLRAGFVQTPQDAFLFGRINNGNVASLPLGLNVGWAGELNLQYVLDELFHGEFGIGYPPEAAERKRKESQSVMELDRLTKRSLIDIIDKLDKEILDKVLSREFFYKFLLKNANNQPLLEKLVTFKS